MGRPSGSGLHRYGPPGAVAHDKEYQNHYRFCRKLGRWASWEEFLANPATAVVREKGKYGPPGAKSRDPRSHRHHQYCIHIKQYITWDEYQTRLRDRKPKNKYGKPGDRCPYEAKNHIRFCNRHGRYFTWDEYRAAVGKSRAKKPKEPRARCQTVLLRPASAIIAKFHAMGYAP